MCILSFEVPLDIWIINYDCCLDVTFAFVLVVVIEGSSNLVSPTLCLSIQTQKVWGTILAENLRSFCTIVVQ